jgi:hypothetical protein
MSENEYFFGEEYNEETYGIVSASNSMNVSEQNIESTSESETTSENSLYQINSLPDIISNNVGQDSETASDIPAVISDFNYVLERYAEGEREELACNPLKSYYSNIAHDCEHRILHDFVYSKRDINLRCMRAVACEYEARWWSGDTGYKPVSIKYERMNFLPYNSVNSSEHFACKKCLEIGPASLLRIALKTLCYEYLVEEAINNGRWLTSYPPRMKLLLEEEATNRGKTLRSLLNKLNEFSGLRNVFPSRMLFLLRLYVVKREAIKLVAEEYISKYESEEFSPSFRSFLVQSPYFKAILVDAQITFAQFSLSVKAHTGPHNYHDYSLLEFAWLL